MTTQRAQTPPNPTLIGVVERVACAPSSIGRAADSKSAGWRFESSGARRVRPGQSKLCLLVVERSAALTLGSLVTLQVHERERIGLFISLARGSSSSELKSKGQLVHTGLARIHRLLVVGHQDSESAIGVLCEVRWAASGSSPQHSTPERGRNGFDDVRLICVACRRAMVTGLINTINQKSERQRVRSRRAAESGLAGVRSARRSSSLIGHEPTGARPRVGRITRRGNGAIGSVVEGASPRQYLSTRFVDTHVEARKEERRTRVRFPASPPTTKGLNHEEKP